MKTALAGLVALGVLAFRRRRPRLTPHSRAVYRSLADDLGLDIVESERVPGGQRLLCARVAAEGIGVMRFVVLILDPGRAVTGELVGLVERWVLETDALRGFIFAAGKLASTTWRGLEVDVFDESTIRDARL
jgi:hypothetical protein